MISLNNYDSHEYVIQQFHNHVLYILLYQDIQTFHGNSFCSYEICVIARRDNDYSEFAGEKQNENSIVELYGKYKDKGKRAALNLQHKDTIEFRMFKSTLKYETFILTLEFVKDIIDYAKSVDIEEIELAKWSDLMNCFSTELREYYEFRYKKKVKDISGLTAKQIRK